MALLIMLLNSAMGRKLPIPVRPTALPAIDPIMPPSIDDPALLLLPFGQPLVVLVSDEDELRAIDGKLNPPNCACAGVEAISESTSPDANGAASNALQPRADPLCSSRFTFIIRPFPAIRGDRGGDCRR
jgi:hypothetical protein